ncbi:MAG: TPM domain-containing protein [Comamonadaceae bacterium]|nr:TPM domain-containing protein [Comamonadaceae bacterium]
MIGATPTPKFPKVCPRRRARDPGRRARRPTAGRLARSGRCADSCSPCSARVPPRLPSPALFLLSRDCSSIPCVRKPRCANTRKRCSSPASLPCTPAHIGILLLVSRFERKIVILPDTGVRRRRRGAFRPGDRRHGRAIARRRHRRRHFHAGLDVPEALLAKRGFAADASGNDIAEAPIQEKGVRSGMHTASLARRHHRLEAPRPRQETRRWWRPHRLAATGLLLLAVPGQLAEVSYLTGRVTDEAQILSVQAREKLGLVLKRHEDQTGNQIAVLIAQPGRRERRTVRARCRPGSSPQVQDNGVPLLVAPVRSWPPK